MGEQDTRRDNPDPDRLAVLRSLPSEVMERLSKEEVNALLFDAVWPNSLKEKLKDYIVDDG